MVAILIKYNAVVIAKNEERHIAKCLHSIKKQTLPCSYLIVVNDNSTDGTGVIADHLADLVILDLRYPSTFKKTGRPELAKVFNLGLACVELDAKYVLLSGADHLYLADYCETLIGRMEVNPNLMVASGRLKGEPHFNEMPRGSGRIVRCQWWRSLGGVLP